MTEQKRGLFITFEGIDGCGKSTQVAEFHNRLFKHSKRNNILTTREPWKGDEIRSILNREKDAYSDADKIAQLFIYDRMEHATQLIAPAIRNGVHVICDRYDLSTIAYQSAQGLDMDGLIQRHCNLLPPDITFIVDTPVEIAIKRGAGNEHKFEGEHNYEFQEKVGQNYLIAAEKLRKTGRRIVGINGTMKIYEISNMLWQLFSSEFEDRIS